MGTPSESRVTVRKFFTCRLRSVLDRGIVGGAFDAAIPASVVVGAVAVLLAVRLVVLLVVGDQIVQGEAVVTGDEVDALLGFALACGRKSRGCRSTGPRVAPRRPPRRGRKLRTSSRNRPFHSFQLSPMKLPTWYRPAASQASAISLVPARAGRTRCPRAREGWQEWPEESRARMEARSKRKPSTCIASTQ